MFSLYHQIAPFLNCCTRMTAVHCYYITVILGDVIFRWHTYNISMTLLYCIVSRTLHPKFQLNSYSITNTKIETTHCIIFLSANHYNSTFPLYHNQGLISNKKKERSPRIFSDLTFIQYFSFYTPSSFSYSWMFSFKSHKSNQTHKN